MFAKTVEHWAPQKIAGGLLTTAGAVTLMGIVTAEALYTAPYNTRMEISDLGATDTGFILHPSSFIFNFTMVLSGAMIVIGTYFLHQTFHRHSVTIPTGLLGVGVLGVGIFPGNIHPQHPLFAFTAFVAGGVAVLLSYKVTRQPLRSIVAVMGTMSLLSTIVGVFLLDWGPIARLDLGGVERWMVYPIVLWLAAFGSYVAASHPADAPELASSPAGPLPVAVSQSKEHVTSSR